MLSVRCRKWRNSCLLLGLKTYLGGNFQLKANTWNTTPICVSLTHVYLEDQPKVCWWRIIAGEQRLTWEEWDVQENIAQCLFRVGSDTWGETWSCPLRGHPCKKMYAMSCYCTPKCHCQGSNCYTDSDTELPGMQRLQLTKATSYRFILGQAWFCDVLRFRHVILLLQVPRPSS